MRSLINFPFPAIPAVFPSNYSLEESVRRLRGVIVPAGFDAETTESAMGSVSVERVRLERNVPLFTETFTTSSKAYFTGSFREDEHGVTLVGEFAGDRWATFMNRQKPYGVHKTIGCVLIAVGLSDFRHTWWLLPVGIGLLTFRSQRQNPQQARFEYDAAWLSQVIFQALTASPTTDPARA